MHNFISFWLTFWTPDYPEGWNNLIIGPFPVQTISNIRIWMDRQVRRVLMMNFRLWNKNSTSILLDIIWYLPDFWNFFQNFEISSGWSYPTFDNLSRINTSNLYVLEILDFHFIREDDFLSWNFHPFYLTLDFLEV